MDADAYAARRDTVRAYKQSHHMGRFDPARANANVPAEASADDQLLLAVGSRCSIEPGSRRGTIRFVGPTEFAQGQWVGVELDEPTGKGNGSFVV